MVNLFRYCPVYFFLPVAPFSSSFGVVTVTFPSITAVLPSKKAMRERPSQFLKESTTSGCWGANTTSATSLDFKEWGASIFLPPVSLPIFHLISITRDAARPHRTNPMGEYPTLSSPGISRVWTCAVKSLTGFNVPSVLYTITSPVRGIFCLSSPLIFMPTLSPGWASSTRLWCISTVKTFPMQGLDEVWVGRKHTSSLGLTLPCSTRPASTSPTPLIL
mmetsp:Transcript_5386/g.7279  ORF Transcript_5386/g.7279 Transcript_5386/m.7279 type:complete len:219 (-) Transcript_5386:892-1548(-)